MFTEAMQPEKAKSNECVTARILLLREEQLKKKKALNLGQFKTVWGFVKVVFLYGVLKPIY